MVNMYVLLYNKMYYIIHLFNEGIKIVVRDHIWAIHFFNFK